MPHHARQFGRDVGNSNDKAKRPGAFYKTNLMDEFARERRAAPPSPFAEGKKSKGIVASLFKTSGGTCSAVVSHHLRSMLGGKRKRQKFRTDSGVDALLPPSPSPNRPSSPTALSKGCALLAPLHSARPHGM